MKNKTVIAREERPRKSPISETYLMDCMDFMRQIPDKHFELAIVDPPYGIGDTWSKSRKDIFYKKGRLHQYQNEEPPKASYFKELIRVSKNQIIWGANYYTKFIPVGNGWVIWNKLRNAEVTFMSEAELAYTSFKKVMRMVELQWDGARKCEVTEKIHPHQKPVALYKWLLKNYAQPGDKILDTHLGSGSSRIAAHDLGFDFFATETDPHYFAAQEKRYQQHIAQLKIFNPASL